MWRKSWSGFKSCIVLTDTNTVIDILSSSALDLSFQVENFSAESSHKKNDEKTPDEEKESVLNESEFQEESLSPAVRETKSKQDRENQNKSSNAESKKKNFKTTWKMPYSKIADVSDSKFSNWF